MGALDHWLNPPRPQKEAPAISAISATDPHFPQKSGGSTVADHLLPPATDSGKTAKLSTDSNKMATDSSEIAGTCYRSGRRNLEVFGEIAEIAEIAGTATPLGVVAAKSAPPPRELVINDWRDFYEERAAILEHDGGLPREQSEWLAEGAGRASPTQYVRRSVRGMFQNGAGLG